MSKVFSWDEIEKYVMEKEDMYKTLNGKQVTAIYSDSEDIKHFALKDSDGKIYIIDEIRKFELKNEY